jgi:hypothetical protein
VVLAVALLAITTMWIYGWFFAPRTAVNRIDDRAWADAAERRCAVAAEGIAALPAAREFDDFDDPVQRARRIEVADQVTAELDAMLTDLYALPAPSGAADRELVDLWLADYRSYLTNRDAHVEQWRRGVNGRFAETDNDGQPISLRMDEFARVNDMESCRVPADLG